MAPLKILHVVEATFAGVGRHVLDLAACQSQAGHEVHVVHSLTREDAAFRERKAALSSVRWHPMRSRNVPAPGDPATLWTISRICRRRGIDIVHGHSTKGGLLARLAATGAGTGTVYTPNAFYSMNPALGALPRRAVGRIERALSARTDRIVVVSPEERDHALGLGVEPAKLTIVPNGIPETAPADRGAMRDAFGVPPDARVVGFVGRLDGQKSPRDLVAVFHRIAAADERVHLVIVGEGPLRDACEADIAARPELAHRVHMPGRRDGFAAMAAFDVFLLPSRYEGFPYVLIEAATNALPIVTTREASASSLVRDGVNGSVRAHGDVAGLADGVLELLRDDARREAAGAASRELARDFTLPRMHDAVERVYREVVAARGESGAVDPTGAI